MSNLLPTREHEELKRQRIHRWISVSLALVSGVFVIGTVLLIPSFVAVISSRDAESVRLETTRHLLDHQKGETVVSDIVSMKDKVSQVIQDDEALSISDTLEHIIPAIPKDVRLQSLLWRNEGTNVVLDMAGSADTRKSLIAFGDALRSSGLFAAVTIPIESLAQQTDLQFRLSLMLAQ